jgi:hypothetical protein
VPKNRKAGEVLPRSEFHLLAKSSRDHGHANQLGAALYRVGRFEGVATPLTEAVKAKCTHLKKVTGGFGSVGAWEW